jgi:L-ascorbate metabolism protein UlaG (beta-lactamase superfamily)
MIITYILILSSVPQMIFSQNQMNYTQIRHATSTIEIANKRILIDPMLAAKDDLSPVAFANNKFKNPMINLPFSTDSIIRNLDYLLLTHLHFDHFDKEAINRIPKSTHLLASTNDVKKLSKLGFTNISPINKNFELDGIKIRRYTAIHGYGLLRYLMGKGSSYLIGYNGFKIFLTGDCILNKSLRTNLIEAQPDIVVANGGAATLRFGKPITMSIKDVREISEILKDAKIILTHMDALNHCTETREYCKEQIKSTPNIVIPNDGETIVIN